MLYAPAVCENCWAVFGSGQLIAESDGEPASYRRSAGPCPHCGGRGTIPEWVFRFHTTASMAADSATPEQLRSLIQALRHWVDAAQPTVPFDTDRDLNSELTGPWSCVAFELRRTPADQQAAKLTFLLWILDRPDRRHSIRDNDAIQVVPPGTSATDTLDDAEDLGSAPCPPFTVIDPPGPGHPGIAITVTSTRRASCTTTGPTRKGTS
jgi:hypothetical protein